jgi:hypothetical protein
MFCVRIAAMTLSDYELRVLRETEDDLAALPTTRRARARRFLSTYALAIVLIAVALAVTISAGLFLISGAAATFAALTWAPAGYVVAVKRRAAGRHTRR